MERSTTPFSERSTASQEYALYYNRSTLPHEPLTVYVNISQASVKMEINTGATITLMHIHTRDYGINKIVHFLDLLTSLFILKLVNKLT